MKRILLPFTFYLLPFILFSQDIHFSQFNQTPLAINPAMTGAFNGDQRVILNHKDQWGGLTQSGPTYRTSLLSFDMGFFKKKWKRSYIGGGLMAFRDKAGDSQLGTTQINISVSSIVSLSNNHKLSAGMQGGYAQKSMSTSNMKWGTQYNSGSGKFDPGIKGEVIVFEPSGFGDLSAGLAWNYNADETSIFANNQFKANFGVGLFHINRPVQTPVDLIGTGDKLFSKIIVHGGFHYGVSNTNFSIVPSFIYFKQGPAQELNLGTMVRWKLKEESKYTGMFKETALSLGGYYRARDAFIPSLLLEYGSFALGITYDINTSELRTASYGKGGIELSLRYINPNPFRTVGTSVRFL